MLKKLKLKNFRSHAEYEIDLAQTTVLVGENGAGKSNILEAISLLSFCRSFRDDEKRNLVKQDADFARIIGDDLEIFLQNNPSFIFQAKVRNIKKRQSEFIGTLKAVVFSPETLSVITGSPRARRKFLDIMISQHDREYLKALVAFEKVRLERNSLLVRIRERLSNETELFFWDEQLVAYGTKILESRKKAIQFLNSQIEKLYQEIAGRNDSVEIEYDSNALEDFSLALSKNRFREISAGRTLIGPHLDDLIFKINHLRASNFASRGEIRSIVLALKIAELEFLVDLAEDERPILLLDDVFSEFDETRRCRLCELIEKYQTVITTTDREHLTDRLLMNAKVVKIRNDG